MVGEPNDHVASRGSSADRDFLDRFDEPRCAEPAEVIEGIFSGLPAIDGREPKTRLQRR